MFKTFFDYLKRAFDPNQPRAPKGSPDGGRWVSSGVATTGNAAATIEEDGRAVFKHSLGIKRSDMPQIKSTDYPEFIEWANEQGVDILREDVPAGSLKPTQAEYNPEQVKSLPKEAYRGKWLTVSRDKYLLDGHNRYVRLVLEDPDQTVKTHMIDLPVREALMLMKEFPKSFAKDVSEVGPSRKFDFLRKYDPNQPREPAGSEEGGQWVKDFSSTLASVEKVLFDDPKRLVHGDTSKNSFFIGPEGEVLSWDEVDWADKDAVRGYTSVHSHLNAGSEKSDKISGSFSPGDMATYIDQAKRFGVMSHIVITSRKTADAVKFTKNSLDTISRTKGWKKLFVFPDYDTRQAFYDENKDRADLKKYKSVTNALWVERLRTAADTLNFQFVTELRIDVPEKALKYDPNQPRAPAGDPRGGQWIAGDNAPAPEVKNGVPNDDYNDLVTKSMEAVRALGFDQDRVDFSAESKTFKLNGYDYYYAGAAHLREGRITIYPLHTDEKSIVGVVAHEIGHMKYESAWNLYMMDRKRIIDSPEDANKLMKPSGELRPDYVKEFPRYAALFPFLEGEKFAVLKEKDGMSDYSKKWWKAYEEGKASLHSALHETIAEINRVVAVAGKPPLWIHKSWRDFYKAVDKIQLAAAKGRGTYVPQAVEAKKADAGIPIERRTIDGRGATVVYLSSMFEVAKSRDDHTGLKIIFDDGEALVLSLDRVKKYDPNQPRHPKGHPQGGQWSPEGEGEGGYEFYSPNEEDSYDFPGAQKRFNDDKHKAFIEKAKEIDDLLGIDVEKHLPALGDTKEWGTEESVYTRIAPNVSYDMVRVSASMKGWLANQKGVVAFKSSEDGPQSMYEMRIPESRASVDDIRKALDDAGLEFRTLVPTRGGTRVVIFDMDNSLVPNMDQVAEKFERGYTYVRGTGEIIEGDGSREDARRTYEGIIEKQMGTPRVREAWDRVRSWRSYNQEKSEVLKLELDWEKRILEAFVSFQSTGDRMMQLTSALHTSRVSAYGFTAEAEALGITEYEITEQLDDRICPVCEEMHGKVFEVEDARVALEEILHVADPNDLAILQPWPRQDEQSLEELRGLTTEELVDRNWHVPPFHPECRGLLVKRGDAPDIRDTPSYRAAFPDESINRPPSVSGTQLAQNLGAVMRRRRR